MASQASQKLGAVERSVTGFDPAYTNGLLYQQLQIMTCSVLLHTYTWCESYSYLVSAILKS